MEEKKKSSENYFGNVAEINKRFENKFKFVPSLPQKVNKLLCHFISGKLLFERILHRW